MVPPKVKYTREEIVQKVLEMTRENGIESVAAREVGKRLGTSSSPIFTAFRNMEELQQEVRRSAMKEFKTHIRDALNYEPAFKYVGIKMIEFAIKEPKLFQLLYMREHDADQSCDDMIRELGDTVEVCLGIIQKDYDLSRGDAQLLFKQTWIHTFGICVLVATKVCRLSQEEISEMLSIEFQGTLILIKSGKFKPVHVRNSLKGEK